MLSNLSFYSANIRICSKISELQDKEENVRLCALGTLNDELRDAEKCYRAFGKLNIVKQLAKVLHQEVSSQPDRVIAERIILNVAIICSWLNGALKVVNESAMIDQIFSLIQDQECISWQAATVLANLSSHPMGLYMKNDVLSLVRI